MQVASAELLTKAQAARAASRQLAKLSTTIKDAALGRIATALEKQQGQVLAANEKDVVAARADGLSATMIDRLLLNGQRLAGMAADVRAVAGLPDPVGESFDTRTMPNGLIVGKRRVPLGVIAAVYESRPNVTVDISVLCLKSGNAVILRGGKEALHSNKALVQLVQASIESAGIPRDAVQFIESTDRDIVLQMLRFQGGIDLLIPRGGEGLIRFVRDNALIPVVTGGIGVCHTFVDSSADVDKALAIAYNAKVQRPTVCNALDTLLVHSQVAPTFLPRLAEVWGKAGVEVHADKRALALFGPEPPAAVRPATREDWGKEFLSLIAAVKVVDSLEEALAHVEQYGSGHSEAIVTQDYSHALRFLDEVDAAVVFVNASTRFTDGGQFGLGAEVAISTNKLHARGPMGLRELTSYKWTVLGDGHIRS
ncbi:MAG: glutamate-5-semialdehyde dehydrogenase [Chloroflexi bacterium]|nr:glutamate-5-semialdehyde dehydrogenase [Chloroflexota bacterium]